MDDFPRNNTFLDGALVSKLRAEVEDLFQVTDVEIPRQIPPELFWLRRQARSNKQPDATEAGGLIIFMGELLHSDSNAAYDLIAERWRAYQYTPMLRRYKGKIALIAQQGIVTPTPTNPWINLGLGIATLLSVWFTGALYECQCVPSSIADWLTGLPMMLTMMIILAAHEFGHYFAARYHKIAVTLPYFIPLPVISPVGTLGAFIQLRSHFKTKKQLFDIGVAGPLGGLIFAIPLIFYGVSTSPVNELTRSESSVLEGNSIFYLFVKYVAHGQLLPSFDQYSGLSLIEEYFRLLAGIIPTGGGTDIFMTSVAFAAWFGLLVTAMNLMPVGQLDGGHVIYCLMGDKARILGMTLIGGMVLAGIFWWTGWLVWAMITYLIIGPGHPPPLNDLEELGLPRKLLAYAMILIFLLLFTPNPLQPL